MSNAQERPQSPLSEQNLTSQLQERKSAAALLSSLPSEEVKAFLDSLSHNALLSLPWLFEHWAHDHQQAPEGDWKTWMIMGGRGAGKTRAGAEWVRSMVEGGRPDEPGRAKRVALVAETLDQARDVMIKGDSGILACTPADRRPEFQASAYKLVWPNGAEAQCFFASNPEALRGPQFDLAWADELAKWKKGRETWDMLQFALRLGDNPQQVITTTPKPSVLLQEILDTENTVLTQAPTGANAAFLADSFLEHVELQYGGSRLGRQEIDGVLLQDIEGALWTHAMLDTARQGDAPELDRIVVAVDPPVTGKATSDLCGIVVVGVRMDGPPVNWTAHVLEDASMRAVSPMGWAQRAVALMDKYSADKLVAEVNQGGDLVEQLVRQVDPMVSYKGVHASRGKVVRAEPVASLYEQERVTHARGLADLEDQMSKITLQGYEGSGSPDRVDALVWALTELLVGPSKNFRNPGIREL